jgi:hypothetical protein
MQAFRPRTYENNSHNSITPSLSSFLFHALKPKRRYSTIVASPDQTMSSDDPTTNFAHPQSQSQRRDIAILVGGDPQKELFESARTEI